MPDSPTTHRSGFVNIIGRPNVGKSTLMNQLVGERMSIITHKPQTTRHRILGIVNSDDYQIIFSDTPGFINDPAYKMQEKMNRFVFGTFEDADVMLFVTEMEEVYEDDHPIIARLQKLDVPVLLVINKIDLSQPEAVQALIAQWQSRVEFAEVIPISAMLGAGTQRVVEAIVERLPEGPAYYPKDQLTDKSERFFVSEMIREKVLTNYRQEIPYSVEVVVESFKEDPDRDLVRIRAEIYVARKTQKSIMIGKGGSAIKQLGTEARKSIEEFLGKQVYLELFVKVKENWRDDERQLDNFGYM